MKILAVYDNNTGKLIFTQTNATEKYSCMVEDVDDNKEVIGVDIKSNKFILADKLATTEEKEKLKTELSNTKKQLLDTQAGIVDSTYNALIKNTEKMLTN